MDLSSFRHRDRARAHAASLASHLSEEAASRLLFLAAASADPDSVLHLLVRLHAENPAEFFALTADSALLAPLVTVFAHSRFLSEEILRRPGWLKDAVLSGDLHALLSAGEMELRLEGFLLAHGDGAPTAAGLAQFRRSQLLRILLRDVSGLATLAEITEELSNLADAILHVSYCHLRDELIRKHGEPTWQDAQGVSRVCEMSIIALGKLGGRELNYSSDIDLMFVYAGNGETNGRRSITNKEFFRKVANQLTALLSTHAAGGICYRVDLRLRPEGSLGEVCLSTEAARQYYRTRGRDWELQMLIKARVAAGDRGPGRELLEFVEPLIYSSSLDFSAVEAVSEARQRIQEKLRRRGQNGEIDVKLVRGGIRDVEFLVQCLQRYHGGREPWVRHGGTLLALFRLRDKNLLSGVEYARLASAYEFFRHIEHRLQLEDDRQTHVLPQDPEGLALLARRMPAAEPGSEPSVSQMIGKLHGRLEDVREIYERVIHAQQPLYQAPKPETSAGDSNLIRFLDQKAPNLATAIGESKPRRGAKALERYLEWVLPQADWLSLLDSESALASDLLDIFEHSPFLSDQLMRDPELLQQLRCLRDGVSPGTLFSGDIDGNALRRTYHREMFRVQCESLCLRTPIFETLSRTSDLADATIQAAYRLAVRETRQAHPPRDPAYVPADQMMVIALGRLGLREFDLASDADLVFVLPPSDAAESEFWTRAATKLIERLSAHTRDGVVFSVDARLRPNGREGPLVQPESSFLEYFEVRAEAWEGISYMKSRAVAGGAGRATAFLNALQEVDWRHYGQSGRSRQQLRQMRLRLEKEQGELSPLKAGPGGYYDIDFALMYLRLKGGGIFFEVLDTPQRIDVIEKMGHLDRADAAFLHDAALLYRAIDHGLRLLSGEPSGCLPKSPSQMEALTALVSRWTPTHLHDEPLETKVEQIRARTREYFQRLFEG